MHSRISQLLVALVVGVLFFGLSGLHAKIAYATIPIADITVCKYNDLDADNEYDAADGETLLSDWKFTASWNEISEVGTTDGEGCVTLYNLFANQTWQLCEELQVGWTPSSGDTCQDIFVTSEMEPIYVGNHQPGTLIVKKLTDIESDQTFAFDVLNDSVPITPTFYLAGGEMETFTVPPGTYLVTETVPAGWSLVSFTCEEDHVDPQGISPQVVEERAPNEALVESGDTWICEFTNHVTAEPVVTKDITATYATTHTWEITKNVTPLQQSAFANETMTWTWSVTVDESSTEGNYRVSGQISVTNALADAAITGTVSDMLDDNTVLEILHCSGAGVDFDLTTDTLTIPGGITAVCDYSEQLSNRTAATNTATFSSGNAKFTGQASLTWQETVVSGTALVNDDQEPDFGNGLEVSFDQMPKTWTETQQHTCSTNPTAYTVDGKYTETKSNTATVSYGNAQVASDVATTQYTCFAPIVSKDAKTSWQRAYGWTIEKSVTPTSHSGYLGDAFQSDYTVTTTQQVTDSGFTAFGTISVTNPAGAPGAITVNVADQIGNAVATVDCGAGSTALTVAAGNTGTCSYTLPLSAATNTTNNATVSFNAINFTASAAVVFGAPTIVGHPTVNVSDSFNGGADEPLGSAGDDKTFTYSRTFTCPVEESAYTDGVYTQNFPNVAEIVETGQQDDASVTLECQLKTGLGDFVWLDLNENGQQDAGEPGLAGVSVNLLQGGTVISTTTTDALGNYAFVGLEPGTYTVQFPTTGLTILHNGPTTTDSDADPVQGETTTTLAPGEYDPTLDAGYKPATLGDFVWTDADSDGIQDGSETGLSGITVQLLQNGSIISTTTTNASGNYLFDKLTPGTYEVCFVLPLNFDFTTKDKDGASDATDSDANEGGDDEGCTGPITLEAGEQDLSWDAGLVATSPTAEEENDQPSGPTNLFLPSLGAN